MLKLSMCFKIDVCLKSRLYSIHNSECALNFRVIIYILGASHIHWNIYIIIYVCFCNTTSICESYKFMCDSRSCLSYGLPIMRSCLYMYTYTDTRTAGYSSSISLREQTPHKPSGELCECSYVNNDQSC